MKKSLLLILLFLVLPSLVSSHGGGLDTNGGHWDRKAGTYHYHRSLVPAPAPIYSTTTTTISLVYAPASTIVFITKTGEKYHYSWCQYLSQSKIEIKLDAAVAKNLEPCSVCRPPQLAIQEGD